MTSTPTTISSDEDLLTAYNQVKVEAAPRAVREIAWKAQTRLCARFHNLTRKGKQSTIVATAIFPPMPTSQKMFQDGSRANQSAP